MNAQHPAGDCARVSVFVAIEPGAAFDVFTQEIDLWWKRGPRYRIAGQRRGQLHFEAALGGRLFESFELDSGPRAIEVGCVTVWEPPTRLQFEWRGVNFKPGEKTVVDVRFEPARDGTLVSLEHRGWSALPAGHPARHGLTGPAFTRMIGMWWGALMTALREYVAETAGPRDR